MKRAASLLVVIACPTLALADDHGAQGIHVDGKSNQVVSGNGNSVHNGPIIDKIDSGGGGVAVVTVPEELQKPLLDYLRNVSDAPIKASTPKAVTDLAAAKLALLIDENPTELLLARAKLGSWVGVKGPTLDVTLKNVTLRTALEIKMTLITDGGKELKLKRLYPGAFRHYSLRGGVQNHLPIGRIDEIEEKTGIRQYGYRVVAVGVSPEILRKDCQFPEYAIGPDMPCRPMPQGLQAKTLSLALRVDYKDVFGGSHHLLTGVYLYVQPGDQVLEPPMTFTGD